MSNISILMLLVAVAYFVLSYFGKEKSRDSYYVIAHIWLAASFIYPAIA